MSSQIFFRIHAIQRMFERGIDVKRVHEALERGIAIEDYSTEMPEPSRLILGLQGKRPVHVVISENPNTNQITVVTVYIPSRDQWKKDFRSRRS